MVAVRDGSARPRPALQQAAAARRCPALYDHSGAIGPSMNPLNRGVEGLGTKALLRTVRFTHGRWRRVDPVEIPAGHAGTWADAIRVRIQKGPYKLDLSVGDLIRVCDCRPGTAAALHAWTARPRKGFSSHTVRVGGHPVVIQAAGGFRSLHLVVSERCQVTLDSRRRGLTTSLYLDALGILDLSALERLCRKR